MMIWRSREWCRTRTGALSGWGLCGPCAPGPARLDKALILTLAMLICPWTCRPQSIDLHIVHYDGIYNANVGRNVALEHARSPFIVTFDVDFVPSGGQHPPLASLQLCSQWLASSSPLSLLPVGLQGWRRCWSRTSQRCAATCECCSSQISRCLRSSLLATGAACWWGCLDEGA